MRSKHHSNCVSGYISGVRRRKERLLQELETRTNPAQTCMEIFQFRHSYFGAVLHPDIQFLKLLYSVFLT